MLKIDRKILVKILVDRPISTGRISRLIEVSDEEYLDIRFYGLLEEIKVVSSEVLDLVDKQGIELFLDAPYHICYHVLGKQELGQSVVIKPIGAVQVKLVVVSL